MTEEIVKDTQVEYIRPIRSGNLIEIGNVVKIDGDKALVHFPTLYRSNLIPLNQLRATSHRFGQIKVQPSPARRTLQVLLNQ